jgi:hypothetical protein
MTKSCSLCQDKRRKEIDKRLLGMETSKETYRLLSSEYKIHEATLRRHKKNHLCIDVSDVHQAMANAREEALRAVKAEELEEIKAEAVQGMAGRLEAAVSFLDQLKVVRHTAADLLDRAEDSNDLRSAGIFLRELREIIFLGAKLTPQDADTINEEAKVWLRKLFAFQYQRMKDKLPNDEEDEICPDAPSEENVDKKDARARPVG